MYKEMDLPIFSSLSVQSAETNYAYTKNMVTYVDQDPTSQQTFRSFVQRPNLTVYNPIPELSGTGSVHSVDTMFGLYHRGTNIHRLDTGAVIKSGVQDNASQFLVHDYNNTKEVIFCDSSKVYRITSAYAVTQITPAPSNPSAWMASLDGYLFIADRSTDVIYNTDLNTLTFNLSINLIRSNLYEGNIIALAKHNNQLLCFKDRSLEFFYDAGLVNTSPLQRNQNMAIQVGCANPYSITQEENQTLFYGAGVEGTLAVWLLDGFQIRKISTAEIERKMNNTTAALAIFMRVGGNTIYWITDINNNNFVFDLDEKVWYTWTFTQASTYFTVVGKLYDPNNPSLVPLVSSTGSVCYFIFNNNSDVDTVRSGGVTSIYNVPYEFGYPTISFGTSNRKLLRSLSVDGVFGSSTGNLIYTVNGSARVTDTVPNRKEFMFGWDRRFGISVFINGPQGFKITGLKAEVGAGIS